MCRIFVAIIKGNILIASVIVICAESCIILFYKNFKFPQIKDLTMDNTEVNNEGLMSPEEKELAETKLETIRS